MTSPLNFMTGIVNNLYFERGLLWKKWKLFIVKTAHIALNQEGVILDILVRYGGFEDFACDVPLDGYCYKAKPKKYKIREINNGQI